MIRVLLFKKIEAKEFDIFNLTCYLYCFPVIYFKFCPSSFILECGYDSSGIICIIGLGGFVGLISDY